MLQCALRPINGAARRANWGRMVCLSDLNNNFQRGEIFCALSLTNFCLDQLVKRVPWSFSPAMSAITVTHFRLCKVDHVGAGLWRCLCSSSCMETQAAGCTGCYSYILTVGILQVLTGVCHGCSRASWYEGWEPSAEFYNVSHSCPLKKKAAQTTLELCPVTVHQPSKVKPAELWERGVRRLSLSGPAHPAGEWQHINKERPPRPPTSSRGLSFSHLISQGGGHRPGWPSPR